MTQSAQGFPALPNGDGEGPARRRNVPWTWSENEVIWSHPDWTVAELAEALPRHTPAAIRVHRYRIGRFRQAAVPLCQKCGVHPVWDKAPDARRWGLCKACALEERSWRLRHGEELARRANAVRQAKFKARADGRSDTSPDGGMG